VPNPQPWFIALATPRIKQAKERDLRERLRIVRKLFSGFEARDGYGARYPGNWSLRRRRELERFSYEANALLSVPSLIVAPKNSDQRAALIKHTGQLHKRQIRFVVHVPAPQRKHVRYVRARVPFPHMGAGALFQKGLRVEVVDKVTGGEMYTRDYLFREILGYQPVLWSDFLDAMLRLLPYLPDLAPSGEEAAYTLLSVPHGPISSPVLKSFLLDEMQDWAGRYKEEFAGLLVGVRYQGDTFRSYMSEKSEYNERQRIRSGFRRAKYKYSLAVRAWNEDEFQERVRELNEVRGLATELPKKRTPSKKKKVAKKRRPIAKRKRSVKRALPTKRKLSVKRKRKPLVKRKRPLKRTRSAKHK